MLYEVITEHAEAKAADIMREHVQQVEANFEQLVKTQQKRYATEDPLKQDVNRRIL